VSDRPVQTLALPQQWWIALLVILGFGGQAVFAPGQVSDSVTKDVTEAVTLAVAADIKAQLAPVLAKVDELSDAVEDIERRETARAQRSKEQVDKWDKAWEAEIHVLTSLSRSVPVLTELLTDVRDLLRRNNPT
jgi:hypothetical protein